MIDAQHFIDDEEFERLPALLDEWRQAHPEMGLLALLPEAGAARVPTLQAACRNAATPLLGGVFPTLLTADGFCGRGMWLLRFDRTPPAFLLDRLSSEATPAAERIAEAAERLLAGVADDAPPTMFMVFDGMVPDIATILTGLYRRLKRRVDYAGANAGSETFRPRPCLFDETRFVGDGVLAILAPHGTRNAVAHGYPVADSRMRATSASGNRVVGIDGKSAFAAYREIVEREFGVPLTRENFYDYGVHYPLGVVTAADVLVRIPVAIGDDDSVHCVGEIPPDSMLRVLRAPDIGDGTCIDTLAARLAGKAAAHPDAPLLVFYCAGRRLHFGTDAATELARLRDCAGRRPIAGALSLGEIDTMPEIGMPRFHNAALVCAHR